jgi:hypothetical protein
MATWEGFREFIKENYVVKAESGNLLWMEFPIGERHQTVLIHHYKDTDGDGWIKLSSAISRYLDGVQIQESLEYIGTQLCGGLLQRDYTYSVAHAMPIADISKEEFEIPLWIVIHTADELEKRFQNGDDTDDRL